MNNELVTDVREFTHSIKAVDSQSKFKYLLSKMEVLSHFTLLIIKLSLGLIVCGINVRNVVGWPATKLHCLVSHLRTITCESLKTIFQNNFYTFLNSFLYWCKLILSIAVVNMAQDFIACNSNLLIGTPAYLLKF